MAPEPIAEVLKLMKYTMVAPVVMNVGEPVMTNDVPVPVMDEPLNRTPYASAEVEVAVKLPPEMLNIAPVCRGLVVSKVKEPALLEPAVTTEVTLVMLTMAPEPTSEPLSSMKYE